jgi:hypothetical protein
VRGQNEPGRGAACQGPKEWTEDQVGNCRPGFACRRGNRIVSHFRGPDRAPGSGCRRKLDFFRKHHSAQSELACTTVRIRPGARDLQWQADATMYYSTADLGPRGHFEPVGNGIGNWYESLTAAPLLRQAFPAIHGLHQCHSRSNHRGLFP